MNTRFKGCFPRFADEGETIASFGQARLVKYLNGKLELRGGSSQERSEAREWVSLFLHEAVIREAVAR